MPLADFQDRFPRLCGFLARARRHDRLGQAYLFMGDDVPLLEAFVLAFAQVCACREPGDDGDACGSCESCRRLAAGTYPEKYLVAPESKSRQISVDDIRRLEHQLGLATEAGYVKFGIIAEADCLGMEAQNAFLKTLEEPPPDTILLLYTAKPGNLLPTTRSRCQTIALMTNRKTYENAAGSGIFPLLAKLRPRAGAAVGLEISTKLQSIFAALHDQAQKLVDAKRDHAWDAVAEGDPALQKELEKKHVAKVEAEYRRRRAEIEDAILTWFLQQMLAAAGIPENNLPQTDMLESIPENERWMPDNPDEAEKNILLAEELIQCLRANVPEALALDVFCLSVTAREPLRKKISRPA